MIERHGDSVPLEGIHASDTLEPDVKSNENKTISAELQDALNKFHNNRDWTVALIVISEYLHSRASDAVIALNPKQWEYYDEANRLLLEASEALKKATKAIENANALFKK